AEAILGERAMHEAWKLRQRRRPVQRLAAHSAHEGAPADLLTHPALEERLRRGPQIELRIELAAEAFDVERRLLQHDELRLDFDVEAPRSLEKAQEQPAEVDFLQRPREHRLAHRADRRLELVDAGAGRHPACLEVRLGDAAIVAIEKSEKVLREVVLIHLGERAHDAEVEPDITATLLPLGRDEAASRLHVS